MSWLISKAMADSASSHCSQDPAAAFSADTCSDGEPYAEWNVMPTQQGFWRNDKMMDASRLSQFGPTLRLLTESRGEGLLTSYLAAFPARTYPSRGRVLDSTVSDPASGASLRGWFAKFSPDSCSWKTAQCSLVEDLELFSETWPRSGLMRNGRCYLRPTAARPILGSEYGLWPTPVARDWRAPGRSRLERTGGKQGECLPQAVGGQLNPTWVEWLIGWPIGWTDLKPLEMDRFREWQQQHSPSYRSKAA